MQTELLRTLLLEYLRTGQKDQHLQFDHCVSGVTGLAIQRCPNELGQVVAGQLRLGTTMLSRLKHVVMGLQLLERVLVPALNRPTQRLMGGLFCP